MNFRQLRDKRHGIVLTILLLQFFTVTAQDTYLQKKILIENKRTTVRQILEKTFPQENIPISYLDNIIPFSKKLALESGEQYTVEYVLSEICKNENLEFEETGGQLILKFYDRPDHEYVYSIYGRVKDFETGETLPGATVYIENINSGVATNGYGVYSMTLPSQTYTMKISYVGYKPKPMEIELKRNIHVDFSLESMPVRLDEVTVDEMDLLELKSVNILSSSNRLDMDMVQNIPYLGEVDVFQGSVLLPGITNLGEGVSGVNVRAGAADQNLIMLDEAVVYNANHFFGLVSVFNPDNVQDVEILKGDLPSKYGGRNSSVMHIRQKEGNENQFHLSGGIGLITSRLMAEGPMLNQSASYLLSARSTFWDLVLRNSRNPSVNDIRANFQDLNAKMKFNLSKNNRIYVAGYLGNDANKFGTEALQKWGNRIVSLRWNNIVKNKHFFNVTSYFSQYQYRVIDESEFAEFVGESQISDTALKFDMTSYVNPRNLFDYGASVIFHKMNPGERVPGPGSGENEVSLPNELGVEPAIYASSENQITKKLTSSLGLRIAGFYNSGNADIFVYDNDQPKSVETITDTLDRQSAEAQQFYYNVLPRVSLKYQVSKDASLKLGYFHTIQYMHLLSNTISPSSSDIWKISGRHIEPTLSKQATVGFYKHFDKLDFSASVEVYYKKLDNTVEFKNGADILFNPAIETELISGEDRIYGVEWFVKKSFGKLKGWVAYTLSNAETRIAGRFAEETINNGQYFASDFNRTHDLAITGIYDFNDRFVISSNFVFFSGRPYSFAESKYSLDGIMVPHFPDRNQNRLDNYHRLDVSATLHNRKTKKNGERKKFQSSWVFSIYNVYGRKNTQSYFFTTNEENPNQSEVQKLSVIGFVFPTVTYNFKF